MNSSNGWLMTIRRQTQAFSGRAVPERTCIVTRVTHQQSELIRFALSPTNEVVPDIAAKLPGRGAWVLNSSEVLATAIARKAFNRAWRQQVKIPGDLVERVDILLKRYALDTLSLANKAGCVICGYTNVNKCILETPNILLLQASDASVEGCRRLARKYRAICDASEIESHIVDIFTVKQISLALGKPNVVHAAIKRETVTNKFINAALRVAKFRSNAAGSENLQSDSKRQVVAIGAGE